MELQDSASVSFTYVPGSGISGSRGSSMFHFLRKLCSFFHTGCTKLHSHQYYTSIFYSLNLCQQLFVVVDNSHFKWYEVISYCGFEVHFTDD